MNAAKLSANRSCNGHGLFQIDTRCSLYVRCSQVIDFVADALSALTPLHRMVSVKHGQWGVVAWPAVGKAFIHWQHVYVVHHLRDKNLFARYFVRTIHDCSHLQGNRSLLGLEGSQR